MNRKSTLSTIALLAALPLGAIAADPAGAPSSGNPSTRESAGEYVDDAAITAKVRSAFMRDKDVKALDVKVETYRGVVQLSGSAKSKAEIDKALQIARSVPGVKTVRNDIQLR